MPENHSTTPNTASIQPDKGWEGLAKASSEWPEDHEGLQLLKKHHVDRILGERGLGHLIVSKEDSAGATFLHKQNLQLNASPEVEQTVAFLRQQGAKIPDKPGKRIEAYLDFVSDPNYVNDGTLTGNQESIDRQIDAVVIKAEDVPESYFELQKRIAREQGRGNIDISDYVREKMIETLQKEQKRSLERWAGYLSSPTNETSYPTWFKKYAFESIQKLGIFDKQKGEFSKRSKGTTTPFADLNPEALGYVLDALVKDQYGEQSEDEKLSGLVKTGNFAQLYAHAILKTTVDPERSKTTDGSWRKFDQIPYDDIDPGSTHSTAQKLADSLQGHGTSWCTAGEETAQRQLRYGDFYVYYSKDAEGNDTVPRVAIRMEDGQVAEVRGIGYGQNLEGEMTDIAQEKFRGLPGGERYEKKAEDMRRLTEIERLMESDPHTLLSIEDIRFLYEFDNEIDGFGWEDEEWDIRHRDPRINELLGKRDPFADMAKVYGIDICDVATNDTFNTHTKVVIGDLDCKNLAQRFARRSISSTVAAKLQTSDFEGEDIDDYLISEPIYAVTGKIVGFDQATRLNVDCLQEILAMEGRNIPSCEDLFEVADSFSRGAQLALFERGVQAPELYPLTKSIDKFDATIDTLPLAERLLAEDPREIYVNLSRFRGLPIDFAHRFLDRFEAYDPRRIEEYVASLIPSGTFRVDTQSLNEFLLKYKPSGSELRPIIEEFTGLDPGILPSRIDLHASGYGDGIDIGFLLKNIQHFREGVDIDGIVNRLLDQYPFPFPARSDVKALSQWQDYYSDDTRRRLAEVRIDGSGR